MKIQWLSIRVVHLLYWGMTVDWTGGGPIPMVTLDRHAGRLREQLQDGLRAAIRDGRLRPGERLPSSRHLAAQLELSRGTVVEVYEQLLAEGYVESAVGSGTRVAPLQSNERTSSPHAKPAPARPVEVRAAVADFEYGIPDLRSAPLADWGWALTEAVRTLPTAELGDGDPAGSPHLREVVTAYHRRVRAGWAEAHHAIVVAGFRQGLAFALAALARSGVERVALEDPGPREHDVIARRAGLDAVAVPVDGDGVDVARLYGTGARAVVLTPAHQCPTGVVLGAARRSELVAWADDVDGVILEDDYDAEFRFDRRPVGSLQGLAPARVIALGSVSKTLAPGLRLGWVLAPDRFVADIVEEKRLSTRGVPALDQEALALLMKTGRFDRHLRRMREVYRRRREVLEAEVAGAFATGRVRGVVAGCHALLRLPDGASEPAVVAAAAARGVRVNGLSAYRFPRDDQAVPPHPPALVLGFGNVDEQQIRRGIRVLAQAVADSMPS